MVDFGGWGLGVLLADVETCLFWSVGFPHLWPMSVNKCVVKFFRCGFGWKQICGRNCLFVHDLACMCSVVNLSIRWYVFSIVASFKGFVLFNVLCCILFIFFPCVDS